MIARDRLLELLVYDPDTGVFSWRVNRGPVKAGATAGRIDSSGHVQITIDGSAYMAHRLAYLYVTGTWPRLTVDHRDRDPANNRWQNLREATREQNMRNCRTRVDSRTGHKGIAIDRNGKYRAYIVADARRRHLGMFASLQQAVHARNLAAKDLHGEFARIEEVRA